MKCVYKQCQKLKNNLKTLRQRKGDDPYIEKALLVWFNEMRGQNAVVIGLMLLNKAKEFAVNLEKCNEFGVFPYRNNCLEFRFLIAFIYRNLLLIKRFYISKLQSRFDRTKSMFDQFLFYHRTLPSTSVFSKVSQREHLCMTQYCSSCLHSLDFVVLEIQSADPNMSSSNCNVLCLQFVY